MYTFCWCLILIASNTAAPSSSAFCPFAISIFSRAMSLPTAKRRVSSWTRRASSALADLKQSLNRNAYCSNEFVKPIVNLLLQIGTSLLQLSTELLNFEVELVKHPLFALVQTRLLFLLILQRLTLFFDAPVLGFRLLPFRPLNQKQMN